MATEGQAKTGEARTTSFRTGFLVVVCLLWGAGLAGGHLLTRVDLTPSTWKWFAWGRVLVQVLPAVLLGGYVLLFVRGPRFMTSRVRAVVAAALVLAGVVFSFGALHALLAGEQRIEGSVEGFDTKTWREEGGVEQAATAMTVRSADGDEDSLSLAGESLGRVQRAGCALGTHATVAYLPGLGVVFSAHARRRPEKTELSSASGSIRRRTRVHASAGLRRSQ